MIDRTDIENLAYEIAEIARTTKDPDTGRQLMELVARLLTEAGLPPGEEGGGQPPSDWLMEPICSPTCM
jgi:hypothetical protein